MICASCKYLNREKAKFSKQCGAKLELACPECGKKIDLETKFSDECGYKLDLVVKDKERPQIQLDVPQSYIPKHLADKILATRRSIEGEETTYSPLCRC